MVDIASSKSTQMIDRCSFDNWIALPVCLEFQVVNISLTHDIAFIKVTHISKYGYYDEIQLHSRILIN